MDSSVSCHHASLNPTFLFLQRAEGLHHPHHNRPGSDPVTTSGWNPRSLKRLASSSSGLWKNTHDTPHSTTVSGVFVVLSAPDVAGQNPHGGPSSSRFSLPRRDPFSLFLPSSSSSTHSSHRSSTPCLSTHEELSSSSTHSSRRVRVVPVFAIQPRRVVVCV
ncbi:hypothetical protein AAHE18_12G084100 [Arachis hypogaea]